MIIEVKPMWIVVVMLACLTVVVGSLMLLARLYLWTSARIS